MIYCDETMKGGGQDSSRVVVEEEEDQINAFKTEFLLNNI
jgi:hypothetical protein